MKLKFLGIAILIVSGCVPLDQSQTANFIPKRIEYKDKIYNPEVGSINFYNQEPLNPPISPLNLSNRLTIRFDIFGSEFESLNAKIIHCDAHWNKSTINDLEYLNSFNEFPVNNYQFSGNSLSQYVHYVFPLPPVKLSGNYLIAVYRNRNPEDLLFTRRFQITESLIRVDASVTMPDLVFRKRNSQKIDLKINYEGLNLKNPMNEVFVVIKQNNRWDNAKSGLKPTNINFANKALEYRYFNGETTFRGGGEFTIVDLRSSQNRGMNVAKIDKANETLYALIAPLKPNASSIYSQPLNADINGKFAIGIIDPATEFLDADYFYATFTYVSPSPELDLYVIGELNNWQLNNQSKMHYDSELGIYRLDVILKQGYYNYTIYNPYSKDNPYPAHGNYHLTENEYEVLVYHRGVGMNYDRIVGYLKFSNSNQ